MEAVIVDVEGRRQGHIYGWKAITFSYIKV
jgi:hypothetical protein